MLSNLDCLFESFYIDKVVYNSSKVLYICESLVDAYFLCRRLEFYGYNLVVRSYNKSVKYPTCRYSVLAYYPKPKI